MKKTKRISTINGLIGFMIVFMLLMGIWGCRKDTIVYATTTDVNMTAYLDKYPEKFSEWRKILDLTGNASFLSAYGAYTMFVPTNEAIKLYLTDNGKTSVDQLNLADLKDMVRFHLLSDTIRSTAFTDGKLPSLTMFGQYLITGSKNVGGITTTIINRQASLLEKDIKVRNGLIYVIDHVLQPAKFSVAQFIENDPKYSIFTQALKATGFYDTLNILPANNPIDKLKFLTILAETDSVLNVAGFKSYADLKAKYSNTGDPKNVMDGLHGWMAYHILYDAKYLADIVSSSSQTTLAPLEILTTILRKDTILINDVTFLGVHEIGSQLNRSTSDNSATNGVVNNVLKHYDIKVRVPFRIDWDVCDFPEIKKLTAYYKKQTYAFPPLSLGQPIKDYFIGTTSANPPCSYNYSSTSLCINKDDFKVPLALGGGGRAPYFEMTTPLIVRGKYKLWIGYNKNGNGQYCQVYVDGVVLPNIINFTDGLPSGSDAELESQGWKHYLVNTSTSYPSRFMGVIDIQTTDRHTIRIACIKGSNNENHVDFIQFIPIADDQLHPKFNTDGSSI